MNLITLPDLIGTDERHNIADLVAAAGHALPTPPLARIVLFHQITGGQTSSRVGDASVTSAYGLVLTPNETLLLPAVAPFAYDDGRWDLSALFLWAASGDTLTIALAL